MATSTKTLADQLKEGMARDERLDCQGERAMDFWFGERGEEGQLACLAVQKISTLILERRLLLDFVELGWQTESPIENAMYWSLLIQAYVAVDTVIVRAGKFASGSDELKPDTLWLESQAKLGQYRVDFLLTARTRWSNDEYADAQVVVECDGHEYHERTKEQARADKSRDRALQAMGVDVLRFTGSEIWRDPIHCAREAITHTTKLSEGRFSKGGA